MSNAIRGLVSKKKKRFQQDGYDLDLTYIRANIIAMGFPSEGREGLYRNKMTDVQRLLKQYHSGHHKVYNLCSEREYPSNSFEKCARYPFDDHNPCGFQMLVEFCKDVHEYLSNDPMNVAAIHCKAGKGRTGLVISCYLQYCLLAKNAEEGLRLFAEQRTKNGKGVTIPSQIRYVKYFGDYMKRYVNTGIEFPFASPPTITLCGTILKGRADFDVGGGCDPYLRIFEYDGTEIYNQKKDKKNKVKNWKGAEKIELTFNSQVRGDFHILCYDEDRMSKDDKMFGLWLNTNFIRKPSLTFKKHELDSAVKDKKHKLFSKDFEFTILFDGVECEAEDVEDDIHAIFNLNRGRSLSSTMNESDDDDTDEEDGEGGENDNKSSRVAPIEEDNIPPPPPQPSAAEQAGSHSVLLNNTNTNNSTVMRSGGLNSVSSISSAAVANTRNSTVVIQPTKPVAGGIAARMAGLQMSATGNKK